MTRSLKFIFVQYSARFYFKLNSHHHGKPQTCTQWFLRHSTRVSLPSNNMCCLMFTYLFHSKKCTFYNFYILFLCMFDSFSLRDHLIREQLNNQINISPTVYTCCQIIWSIPASVIILHSSDCFCFLRFLVLEALYWIKQWVIPSLKAWQSLLLLLMVSWMPQNKLWPCFQF